MYTLADDETSPAMISFLHLGPLANPAFGPMVATGLLVAAFILQSDIDRSRGGTLMGGRFQDGRQKSRHGEGFLIVGAAGLSGLIVARLYNALENPRDLMADPWLLVSRSGFAWFGGILGGIVALLFLAKHFRIPALEFMDLCSPATAVGYAIGRIGYLLSGVGDYRAGTSLPSDKGFPNGLISTTEWIHPAALYEFFIWLAIAGFLWHMGRKALRGPKAKGEVFCNFLILTGFGRFLIEFLRINPRSFLGLTNVQVEGVASLLAGAALLWRIKSRFHARDKVHRIIEHITERGDVLQAEYHKPTPECPNPERWHMYDSMTAEAEVLDFLKMLVTTVKPELVVETGTFSGLSTLRIAEGLQENGFGRVITCEYDAAVFAAAKKRFDSSSVAQWIDARNESSLEMKIDGRIDLLFCDSDTAIREKEVRHFLPQVNPCGLILIHDASSAMKTVREAALRLESEGLLAVLLLPTPRGLVMAQKLEGRA